MPFERKTRKTAPSLSTAKALKEMDADLLIAAAHVVVWPDRQELSIESKIVWLEKALTSICDAAIAPDKETPHNGDLKTRRISEKHSCRPGINSNEPGGEKAGEEAMRKNFGEEEALYHSYREAAVTSKQAIKKKKTEHGMNSSKCSTMICRSARIQWCSVNHKRKPHQ